MWIKLETMLYYSVWQQNTISMLAYKSVTNQIHLQRCDHKLLIIQKSSASISLNMESLSVLRSFLCKLKNSNNLTEIDKV